MFQWLFDFVHLLRCFLFPVPSYLSTANNQCRKLGLLEEYYTSREVPEVFGFSVAVEMNQPLSNERVRDILVKLIDTFPRLASQSSLCSANLSLSTSRVNLLR